MEGEDKDGKRSYFKWTNDQLLKFVSVVSRRKGHLVTEETMDDKWDVILRELLAMEDFKSLKITSKALKNKYQDMAKALLKKTGTLSEGPNLSALPSEPSTLDSMILTMEEEKFTKETKKKEEKVKAAEKKKRLHTNELDGLLKNNVVVATQQGTPLPATPSFTPVLPTASSLAAATPVVPAAATPVVPPAATSLGTSSTDQSPPDSAKSGPVSRLFLPSFEDKVVQILDRQSSSSNQEDEADFKRRRLELDERQVAVQEQQTQVLGNMLLLMNNMMTQMNAMRDEKKKHHENEDSKKD